jgi:hypothetical protein
MKQKQIKWATTTSLELEAQKHKDRCATLGEQDYRNIKSNGIFLELLQNESELVRIIGNGKLMYVPRYVDNEKQYEYMLNDIRFWKKYFSKAKTLLQLKIILQYAFPNPEEIEKQSASQNHLRARKVNDNQAQQWRLIVDSILQIFDNYYEKHNSTLLDNSTIFKIREMVNNNFPTFLVPVIYEVIRQTQWNTISKLLWNSWQNDFIIRKKLDFIYNKYKMNTDELIRFEEKFGSKVDIDYEDSAILKQSLSEHRIVNYKEYLSSLQVTISLFGLRITERFLQQNIGDYRLLKALENHLNNLLLEHRELECTTILYIIIANCDILVDKNLISDVESDTITDQFNYLLAFIFSTDRLESNILVKYMPQYFNLTKGLKFLLDKR